MSRSVVHANFTITRSFHVAPEKVFQAFADPQRKERWFKGPDDGDTSSEHRMEFRVGGHETNTGTFHDGIVHRFEALYYDIVPNERIVYAYEMYLDKQRISVSLATIELTPADEGTAFRLIESGVFLDGFDKPEERERGSHDVLDALGRSLEQGD